VLSPRWIDSLPFLTLSSSIFTYWCYSCDSWSLFPGNRLDLRQQIPKLPVVYLHPVIEIKADPQVGIMAQFFIKSLEFSLLFDEFVLFSFQFLSVGSGGGGVDVP